MMLYPMAAMVALTVMVMMYMLFTRVRGVAGRRVSIGYFRVYQGDCPEELIKPARNTANLFETPVLFYTFGVLAIVLDQQTPLLLNLAWVYVGLRMIHSLIHLSYNNVNHRLAAFLLSMATLVALWAILVMGVIGN